MSCVWCVRWVVERLGKNLDKELDFRIEADNAARFATCMSGNPNVAVPCAVPEVREGLQLPLQALEEPGLLAAGEGSRAGRLEELKLAAKRVCGGCRFLHSGKNDGSVPADANSTDGHSGQRQLQEL